MNGTENETPDQPAVGTADWVAAVSERMDRERAELLERAGVSSMEELVAKAAEEKRRQAMPAPTWRDLEEALTTLGSEDNIARRLEILRGIRGLSQEQLAKKLDEVGVQMPQSSISKIEAPMRPGGRGKRRDITVDEAIALAKVLRVPVSMLILPDNALDDLHLQRILAAGADLWEKRNAAQLEYDYAVGQLVQAAAERPAWRERLVSEHDRLDYEDDQGNLRHDRPLPKSEEIPLKWFLDDIMRLLDEADGEVQS